MATTHRQLLSPKDRLDSYSVTRASPLNISYPALTPTSSIPLAQQPSASTCTYEEASWVPALLTPPPTVPISSSATSPTVSADPYPEIHSTGEQPFEPWLCQIESDCFDVYQSICLQPLWSNASFEELRYLDYYNDRGAETMGALKRYAQLLSLRNSKQQASEGGWQEEVKTTPLFRWPLLAATNFSLKQYSILGQQVSPADNPRASVEETAIFLNTNAPWSAFLCGSQGSGKSYTLSCMLENCLLDTDRLGVTPNPMAGIIFAYDQHSQAACEAAYVGSAVPVDVLVPPSNYHKLKTIYEGLPDAKGRIKVHPLFLKQQHMNTERLMKLMAFDMSEGSVPLYIETIIRILKEMAFDAAEAGTGFNYPKFLQELKIQNLTREQQGPLNLRLDLLDSFIDTGKYAAKLKGKVDVSKNLFAANPGRLTIVDLSDPFVDPSSACVLFDICLALFLEDRSCTGKIIALDEAHKFMTGTAASDRFTNSLLTVIREQRHKGARIVIATQEPTVSPKLLDLCTMTFVHRFTSPDWLNTLRKHLAGASLLGERSDTANESIRQLFHSIVNLNVGESLLFSPNAMLHMVDGAPEKLGTQHIKFKTRKRITNDGGMSILAT